MKVLLTCFGFVLQFTLSVYAQTTDVDYFYTRIITYDIEEDGDSWTASGKDEISRVYKSERSLKDATFFEHSSVYRTIQSVNAWINGKSIAEKWIKKLEPTFDDTFLQDDLYYQIELPKAPAIGDSLHYVVERSFRDITDIALHPIPNYNQTKEFTIVVNHPDDVTVSATTFAARSVVEPLIIRVSAEQTKITLLYLEYQTSLVFFPFDDIHCTVRLDLFKDGKPIMNSSPTAFGESYKREFNQTCDLSASQRAKVLEFCKGAKTQLDTIRALHDYVRGTIRYVDDERNVNAYVPRMPSVVFEQKYGDCKDRAHFVSSFARSLGYNVGMALICTRPQLNIITTVHKNLFDHVICYVVVENDTLFFDPTARFTSLDGLPEMDVERPVFLLHTNPPKWSKTRRRQTQPSLKIIATMDASKPDSANATIELRNDMASSVMYMKQSQTQLENRAALSSLIGEELQKIKVVNATIVSESDTLVTIAAKLDLQQYLIRGSNKVYMPYLPINFLTARLLERKQDTLPIILDDVSNVFIRFSIKNAPTVTDTTVQIEGPYGATYSVSIKKIGSNVLELTAQTVLSSKKYDGSKKQELLDFVQQYLKQKKLMVSL